MLFLLRNTPGEDHTGHVRHAGRKVHLLAVAGVRAVRGQLCVREARAQSVPRREPRHDQIGILRRQCGHVPAGHDLQQHGPAMGQLSHSGTKHYNHAVRFILDQHFTQPGGSRRSDIIKRSCSCTKIMPFIHIKNEIYDHNDEMKELVYSVEHTL